MWLDELVDLLITNFKNRAETKRPFIIGLDGLGGAGKTSLAKKLQKEMQQFTHVSCFHIDDYIVKTKKRYNTGYEEWYEYYYLQWDISYIRQHFLKRLYDSTEIRLFVYDKLKDEHNLKTHKIENDSIVIIEGVFLQRREWKKYYDYILFLDCLWQLKKERVLDRDLYIGNERDRLTKYENRYWPAEHHYVKVENPMESAHTVIFSDRINDCDS